MSLQEGNVWGDSNLSPWDELIPKANQRLAFSAAVRGLSRAPIAQDRAGQAAHATSGCQESARIRLGLTPRPHAHRLQLQISASISLANLSALS